MLQLINKNKIYFYIITFLFLSTILNKNLSGEIKRIFIIKKIEIKTNFYGGDEIILSKLNHLFEQNIFSLSHKKISENLEKLNFLEKIQVIKKYPSQIQIRASKTDLIAKTYYNQKKYFIGGNGKLIPVNYFKDENKLPIIFGKFQIEEFFDLQNKLKNKGVNTENITKYFFHKNKRWDLYLVDKKIIKLPNKNLDNAIDLYNKFKKSDLYASNIIIDLRIPNRIIIQNE